MHRLAVTFVSCRAVKIAGSGEVFLYADAFFVKARKPELRRCQSFLGRALEPAGGRFVVLANNAALSETNRYLVSGRWVAGESR